MGKVIRNIVIVVLVLVVLIGAVSALVVTRENEYTIVRQFGRVVSIRDTAGLSFKIPFLQDVQTLPNTVLLYDLPVSDVITKDKKTMVADSFVLWRISDPQKFIQTLNSSVSNAESRLSTLVYNAMNNTISGMNQSEVISGRDGELASAIKAGVTGLDQYGIELIAVETKRLGPARRQQRGRLPADDLRAEQHRRPVHRLRRERGPEDPLRDRQGSGDYALRGQGPGRGPPGRGRGGVYADSLRRLLRPGQGRVL